MSSPNPVLGELPSAWRLSPTQGEIKWKEKGDHEKSENKTHTPLGGRAWGPVEIVRDKTLVTLPLSVLPGILTNGTFWKEA